MKQSRKDKISARLEAERVRARDLKAYRDSNPSASSRIAIGDIPYVTWFEANNY